MSGFKDWWNGPTSPARRMPVTTADQCEWMAKAAYEAGETHEREGWRVKQEKKDAPFTF